MTPSSEELARRGHRVSTVTFGQPSSVQGDLDKADVRKFMEAKRSAFERCYTTELAVKPTLEGSLMMQFFIAPNGDVTTATGSGVDGAVSSCFAAVTKAVEFPKPKGGGGAQVDYPFMLRH